MAGSRSEKVGTIFSRVTGLLRSGALKEEDKPIWYEVYKAFPPKLEPRFNRPAVPKEIPAIFYKEDIVRARFYKAYPNAIVDMKNEKVPSVCQRFVQKYFELNESGKYKSDNEIFEAAVLAMSLPGAKQQETEYQLAEEVVMHGEKDHLSVKEEKEEENTRIEFKLSSVMKSSKDASKSE